MDCREELWRGAVGEPTCTRRSRRRAVEERRRGAVREPSGRSFGEPRGPFFSPPRRARLLHARSSAGRCTRACRASLAKWAP
eukprot:6344484-Pyramimonas_sp.AAC.1